MVEIVSITPSRIKLKGITISDGEKVKKIMDICHEYKHMYKDGYPYGRKTRKLMGKRLKKWTDCPQICFTYLVTDDNEGHYLAIHVLVSDTEELLKRYTEQEIEYYMQMYVQDVANKIIATM